MPNWVRNEITIKGSKKDLDDFVANYFSKNDEDNTYFDFDKVIPEPRREECCPKDCIRKEGDAIEIFSDRPWFNWYAWRYKHWGVKWNSSDTYFVRESNNRLIVEFNTPWASPQNIFNALKTQNPFLDFKIEVIGEEDW